MFRRIPSPPLPYKHCDCVNVCYRCTDRRGDAEMWDAVLVSRDNNFIIFCPSYIHSHQRSLSLSVGISSFFAFFVAIPTSKMYTRRHRQSNISSNCWRCYCHSRLPLPHPITHLSICVHCNFICSECPSPFVMCVFFAFTLNRFLLFARLFVCAGMCVSHQIYIGLHMLSSSVTTYTRYIQFHRIRLDKNIIWLGDLTNQTLYKCI